MEGHPPIRQTVPFPDLPTDDGSQLAGTTAAEASPSYPSRSNPSGSSDARQHSFSLSAATYFQQAANSAFHHGMGSSARPHALRSWVSTPWPGGEASVGLGLGHAGSPSSAFQSHPVLGAPVIAASSRTDRGPGSPAAMDAYDPYMFFSPYFEASVASRPQQAQTAESWFMHPLQADIPAQPRPGVQPRRRRGSSSVSAASGSNAGPYRRPHASSTAKSSQSQSELDRLTMQHYARQQQQGFSSDMAVDMGRFSGASDEHPSDSYDH